MNATRRAVLATPFAAMLASTAVSTEAWADDPAAATPIQALNQALAASMRAGSKSPFTQRFNLVAPAVDGAFDLPGVLAASVGPRYASLPADQQTALLDAFRKFTVASYAANFDVDDGTRLEMVPTQRMVGSDVVVSTRIVPRTGDATPIDYVMRRGPQGWRAVDVLLNGSISQNAVKRSDFRSLVAGTSAQPLIDSLRRKVAELSGGTLS